MDPDDLATQLAAGRSIESIARDVGRDPSTVAYWVNKYNLASSHAPRHATRGRSRARSSGALVLCVTGSRSWGFGRGRWDIASEGKQSRRPSSASVAAMGGLRSSASAQLAIAAVDATARRWPGVDSASRRRWCERPAERVCSAAMGGTRARCISTTWIPLRRPSRSPVAVWRDRWPRLAARSPSASCFVQTAMPRSRLASLLFRGSRLPITRVGRTAITPFGGNSMAECSAVNRVVVGSSPTPRVQPRLSPSWEERASVVQRGDRRPEAARSVLWGALHARRAAGSAARRPALGRPAAVAVAVEGRAEL
jgi:hypothetical protein